MNAQGILNMSESNSLLISPKDAASLIGVSVATFYRHCYETLPARSIGSKVFFLRAEVETYAREGVPVRIKRAKRGGRQRRKVEAA
jgi:predicted DNA-binding transcriptional regulator AlpA